MKEVKLIVFIIMVVLLTKINHCNVKEKFSDLKKKSKRKDIVMTSIINVTMSISITYILVCCLYLLNPELLGEITKSISTKELSIYI